MLRVRNLQVDVPDADHDDAVAFWTAALGGTPRATHEPEYTHLDHVRAPLGVHVQRLGPGGAPGYHLDLEAEDLEAALDHARATGARDVGPLPGGEAGAVLADPAGLRFCLTGTGQPQHLAEPRPGAARLHTLLLDVPADRFEATVAFWARLLDAEAREVGAGFEDHRWFAGAAGPSGPVLLAAQSLGRGDARMHVDLHVDDPTARDVEVARLTDAGATTTGGHAHWTTLRAPGGHVVCVVPDRA